MVLATILILTNSPTSGLYESFLHIPVEVRFGVLHLDKTLYHFINDCLMAIFFLLIGIEVKREILEGHLSSLRQIALPGIATVGGMIVPAIIYLIFNWGNPIAMRGWAIPRRQTNLQWKHYTYTIQQSFSHQYGNAPEP